MTGSSWWALFLSHLLFQLLELASGRRFALRAIHVRFQQLVLEVHTGTRPARLLDVAPRALDVGLCARRGFELCLHVIQLALRQRQLLALGRQLALEHADALAMLG